VYRITLNIIIPDTWLVLILLITLRFTFVQARVELGHTTITGLKVSQRVALMEVMVAGEVI
jgi:hypothetical protein